MIIAVNARMLLPLLEGVGHYTFEVVNEMAKAHPEDEFHLIFDRKYDSKFIVLPNVHGHVLTPPTRHPLLWYIWFEYRIPRLLKKIGADVFFSPDGHLSLRNRVPTLLTIHDLAYLHFPEGSQRSHRKYLQKNIPKFIKKAELISCVSRFTRDDLIAHFPEAKGKTYVAYNGVREIFSPMPESDKKTFRNKVSNGAPYFLYLGSMHLRKNIVRIIKAFDLFKKHSGRSTKLILAGRMAWNSKDIEEALLESPFRDSIIHLSKIDKCIESLVGSAEAMIYVSLFEGFGLPVLEAMACGVPVITSKNSAMEEICGESALYVNPIDVNSISEQMENLIGDNDIKKRLIKQGLNRVQDFSWTLTAASIYKNLRSIIIK